MRGREGTGRDGTGREGTRREGKGWDGKEGLNEGWMSNRDSSKSSSPDSRVINLTLSVGASSFSYILNTCVYEKTGKQDGQLCSVSL